MTTVLDIKNYVASELTSDVPEFIDPRLITRLFHIIFRHSEYYSIEELVNDVVSLNPRCFILRKHTLGIKAYTALLRILEHKGLITSELVNEKLKLLSKEQ